MGLMGNPVKYWSGPAAVIPISTVCFGIRSLYILNATCLVTGKASRDRESQKTCLDLTSQRSLRGERL